jgi:ferric-dicitrate binding protein FerR (iron transport regulator)
MVSPAWAGGEAVGSVTSSKETTVRDTKLTPGSTVFSGDVISVAEQGVTQIALTGGSQAEVLSNSSVRLTKANDKIQMVVNRGHASFHTAGNTGNNGVSALVGNATVCPVNGAETSAVIQSLSETHATVAAEKGALLVTTANDGKVYTVREGEAADLSATPDPQQNGQPSAAGKAAPALAGSKTGVIWTVVIVSAAVAVGSYFLIRKETTPSQMTLGDEISPDKLN